MFESSRSYTTTIKAKMRKTDNTGLGDSWLCWFWGIQDALKMYSHPSLWIKIIKICCFPKVDFELCCWRRLLRIPWTRRSNQSVPKEMNPEYSLKVQFSRSIVSDSLRPHGLQHARLPCPSPTPRVYPNSCPLSWWCHPNISSRRPLLLLPSIFPNIRVFSNEPALHIRWPKYWSFSFNISPSNEHSGLISFRMS